MMVRIVRRKAPSIPPASVEVTISHFVRINEDACGTARLKPLE
ncbi:hypothetical protein BWQ96_08434 [Gracilariopsis chorda]|uniref:Uncharacterized protein n=1 Tax=Gracilariopsis chorda TaxID=448386 RepID=A0A2V3IIC4_9FLOR|nr:hypothetical protein BWQ96_08434 [Gracilariopsis chorda]|eukprot:PXF41855.1 hypothetical protein BWQ96_08434 [Gracilariopsis chorda]